MYNPKRCQKNTHTQPVSRQCAGKIESNRERKRGEKKQNKTLVKCFTVWHIHISDCLEVSRLEVAVLVVVEEEEEL